MMSTDVVSILHGKGEPKLLGVADAAQYLGVGRGTVYRLASDGMLVAAKLGKRWVFTRAALDEFLAREAERQTAERRANG